MVKKKFLKKNITLGYQEYIVENINDAILISTNAISLGSKYIEKHVTLSRKLKIDSSSSLEPFEFKKYLEKINQFKKILGTNELVLSRA